MDGSCSAGFCTVCFCAPGPLCLDGAASLLTLSWHSLTHQISSICGTQRLPPPYGLKRVMPHCWRCTWDPQWEKTILGFSEGLGSAIVSCQTSKVTLMGLSLTFSSRNFTINVLAFWQWCLLCRTVPLYYLRHWKETTELRLSVEPVQVTN